MATFQEVQARLQLAKNRRTILVHLMDYLDTNFRQSAGEKAKKILLNDDKVPIPEQDIEFVLSGLLMSNTLELEQEVDNILSLMLNAPPPIVLPGHEIWAPQSTPQSASVSPVAPVQLVPVVMNEPTAVVQPEAVPATKKARSRS